MQPASPTRSQHRIDTCVGMVETMRSPHFTMAGAEERIMFLEGTLIMTESQWQRYLRRSARIWPAPALSVYR